MIDSNVSMKRFISFCFTVISIVFMYCACSEDDRLQQSGTDIAVLPIGDTDVDPLGDEWAVAFTSESDWSIRITDFEGASNVDWAEFTPTKGDAGTTEVTITVLPNVTDQERGIKVIFDRDNPSAENQEFRITQEPAVLDPSSDNVECGWLGDVKRINVRSNIRWKLSLSHGDATNKEWLDVSTGQFHNDRDIDIEFTDNNFSGADHRAEVILTPRKLDIEGKEVSLDPDVLNSLTRKVGISQSNLIFLVNGGVGDPELEYFSEFGPVGQSYEEVPVLSHDVVVTSETDWELRDKPDWIDVEQVDQWHQQEVVLKNLRISVNSVNDSREPKDEVLRLVSVDDDRVEREIRVVQNGYKLDATLLKGGSEIDEMPVDDSAEAELFIDTKGPWKIDRNSIPDWLKIDDGLLSGVGEARIPVASPIWNLEQDELPADIYINTADIYGETINGIDKSVPVKKAPFVFKIGENIVEGSDREVRDILAEISMKNTVQYDLEVDSSGPWDVSMDYDESSDKDWFNVSATEGEKGTTLKVGALEPNPNKDKDRSLILTFVSRMHKDIGTDLSVRLAVTQTKYIFTLSPLIFEDVPAYKKNGIQYTSELKCSYDWECWVDDNISVTSDPSGKYVFTEDQRDGTLFRTLYLNVGTNTLKSPVTKKVYVQSEYDNTVKEIQIHQDAFVFNVDKSDIPSGQLPYAADAKYTVKVESTDEVRWEVRNCPTWFKVNSAVNESSEDLEFTVTPNGGDERNSTFAIYNTVSGESQSITVRQAGYYFNVDKSSLAEFDELKTDDTQTITATCAAGADGWKIKSAPGWINYTKDDDKVLVSADQNLGSRRTGTIVLESQYQYANSDRKTRNISVSQREYVFDVTHNEGSGNIALPDFKGTVKTLNIKSSGKWAVSSDDEDAVSVSPESGNASRETARTCRLTINPNYDGLSRKTTITVQSEHFGSDTETPGLKKTIVINQPGYEFTVGADNLELGPDKADGHIDVRCSGTWSVDRPATATWLTVSSTDSGIEYSVQSNKSDGKNDTSEREAVITVKTTDGSGKERKITIKQSGEKAQ